MPAADGLNTTYQVLDKRTVFIKLHLYIVYPNHLQERLYHYLRDKRAALSTSISISAHLNHVQERFHPPDLGDHAIIGHQLNSINRKNQKRSEPVELIRHVHPFDVSNQSSSTNRSSRSK